MWPSPLSLTFTPELYGLQRPTDCVETNEPLLPLPQSPILSRMTSEPIRNELIPATSQPLLCWVAVVTELITTAFMFQTAKCVAPPPHLCSLQMVPGEDYITPTFQNLPHPFNIFTTPTKQTPLRHSQHRGCGICILILTSRTFLNFYLLS